MKRNVPEAWAERNKRVFLVWPDTLPITGGARIEWRHLEWAWQRQQYNPLDACWHSRAWLTDAEVAKMRPGRCANGETYLALAMVTCIFGGMLLGALIVVLVLG